MAPRVVRPRLAVLPALRAQGGTRTVFVPRADVLDFDTPRRLDGTGEATLHVRANSRAATALATRRVLEVEDFASFGVVGGTEEWRILTVRRVLGRAAGADGGVIACTLVHPATDWPDAGRVAAVSGGRTTWTHSGIYTPTTAMALALGQLALHGQGHWTLGTVERADRRRLEIVDLDAAQLRDLVLATWALEPLYERTAPNTWTVHLLKRRGGAAGVPTLRLTGALERLEWVEDATTLATAVLPTGALGGTVAYAGWTVASVTAGSGTTGVIGLTGDGGDPGPVQIDGQLATAYLRKIDGTLTQITATARGDGTTSLVTVADRTGVSAGGTGVLPDVVEIRRDGAGTRVVVLTDPTLVNAYGYREVPLPRTDLVDARNHISNSDLAVYTSPTAEPTGWSSATVLSPLPAWQRVTTGYPTGNPAGEVGWMWKAHFGNVPNLAQRIFSPIVPAIDPTPGDDAVSWWWYIWIDADLHDDANDDGPILQPLPIVRLLNVTTGAVLDSAIGTVDNGQTWLRIGGAGLTLPAEIPVVLDCQFLNGFEANPAAPTGFSPYFPPTGIDVYVVAVQVTRSVEALDYVPGSQVNLLWQAANAHLLSHGMPVDQFTATVADTARAHPDLFGDVPLVEGGDVRLLVPSAGIDRRVRVLSAPAGRLAPASRQLETVGVPNAEAAALLGATVPTRERDLIDVLRGI
jgi:hypothetical protein